MAYEADRRVILRHQNLREQVAVRIERYITARWNNLGSWRQADVDEFIRQVWPAIEAGTRTTAQMTNSYLDAAARLAGVTPSPTELATMAYPRGVEPELVYRRGATTLYTGLSEGKPFNVAYAESVKRLRDLVRADLQMAARDAANAKLSGDGRVVGYRRVLAPGENCALCAIASTQRYHREDLMPIHSGCRCDIAPIYGTHDPGQVINEERYYALMEAMDEADIDYTRLKAQRFDDAGRLDTVMVRNHGEHGPVLTWRGQKFTGPSDI